MSTSSLSRIFLCLYAIALTLSIVYYLKVLDGDEDLRVAARTTGDSEDGERNKRGVFVTLHDEWIDIGEDIKIYSAYWEERDQVDGVPFVRIIGIAPRWLQRRRNTLRCLLWYDGIKETIVGSKTVVRILNEHHYKPKGAAFFECHPPDHLKTSDGVPYAVSIEWSRFRNAKMAAIGHPNPVIVRLIPPLTSAVKDEIVACVKPMYGPFNDLQSLAEFIAFYHIMGVTKFVIYVAGISPNVRKFLNKIKEVSKLQIDLLPWNIWMFWDEIHDNAGIASFNDCVYRYMGRAEYLLVADYDEFLVPHNVTTYQKLLSELQSSDLNQKFNSFIFQNRFYCLERNRIPINTNEMRINVLLRTTGVKEMWWPYGLRNKYILKPSMAIQAGYHNLWEYLPNTSSMVIPSNVGYSHHYRECGPLEDMAIHNQGKEWKLPPATYIQESYMTHYDRRLNRSPIINAMWNHVKSRNVSRRSA